VAAGAPADGEVSGGAILTNADVQHAYLSGYIRHAAAGTPKMGYSDACISFDSAVGRFQSFKRWRIAVRPARNYSTKHLRRRPPQHAHKGPMQALQFFFVSLYIFLTQEKEGPYAIQNANESFPILFRWP